jgi:hypothetical protein
MNHSAARFFQFMLVLIASCNAPAEAESEKPKELQNISYSGSGELDLGTFDSVTYRNNYFGFSVDAPGGEWTILNQEQYNSRVDANVELLEESGVNSSALEASRLNTQNLLSMRKGDPNTSSHPFQAIMFVAEALDKMPGVYNALDYVNVTNAYVEKHLSSGNMKYTVMSVDSGTIANRVFLLSTWKIQMSGLTYFQETYTAQYGNYVLSVIETYQTKEESAENDKILSAVKWN